MTSTADELPARRREGAATRARAQQVARRLFTEQGYEATSLRQIAEVLGINKASLYYHFASKEAILRSLFEERGSEAEELDRWLEQQPAGPRLVEDAVLRWVASYSADKLAGIRFLRANPLVARTVSAADGDRIAAPLTRVADRLVALLPDPSAERAVLVRMALLGINAAVEAAAGTDLPDEQVVAAARTAAVALVRAATRP